MQVKELDSKGLKKSFKITVDAASLSEQMQAELKVAGQKVKIPGFRPGNIPMKVLQQRYGKSIEADVLNKSINRAASDVLRERNLRPALTPSVDDQDYAEGGDLSFTLNVEVFPEIPDVKFDAITIERPVFEIAQKTIDEAAARVAERNPKLTPLEDGAKAKLGNIVRIDFKGMIDGKVFDGGTSTDFRLELGSGQFIEGFEGQLVGSKVGDDKIVKVTFPKDYPGAEVAGKEASFAVKVHEILAKDLPAIDDEFAKSLGFNDLAALHDAIRQQMTREYDGVVRGKLKKQLFDALEKSCNFDLPQGMLDMEFNTIWGQLKQSQGEEVENDSKLKGEYEAIAKRRVKLGILLAEIGSKNKIQISREEMTRAVMQQASQFPGQEQQVMDFYRKNPDYIENLRGPILEEKAVDFILGQVKFNDKKTAIEDLIAEDEEAAEADAPKKKGAKAKDEGEEKPAKAKAKKKAGGE